MQKRIKSLIAIAASLMVMSGFTVFADEPIAQGEAAIVLAQRLGLGTQTARPLTSLEAVKLLMENNITPFGGWQVEEPLTNRDLERILVQALGRVAEIPAEERDNPETNAYREFLIAEYNLNLETLSAALAGAGRANERAGSGIAGDGTSTDPLRGRGGEGETNEIAGGAPAGVFIPVSLPLIVAAVTETVPSRGSGRRGRPAPPVDVVDPTPTEPAPAPAPAPVPPPSATPALF